MIKKMKRTTVTLLNLVFISAGLFQSCEKEEKPVAEPVIPTPVTTENIWTVDSLKTNTVKWYRLTASETATLMQIEWSELNHSGSNRKYTGDIKVSAYKLDGKTAYFENEDLGYATDAKKFDLTTEKNVLVKVELATPASVGTYAIRFVSFTDNGGILFSNAAIGSNWISGTIAAGQKMGFTFDCDTLTKVKIMWAEEGSPESGFTAEIMGSVYKMDGTTPYKDVANNKDIVMKTNSWSDNPKMVYVDKTEKKIKVIIEVNTKPGTYALKVVSAYN